MRALLMVAAIVVAGCASPEAPQDGPTIQDGGGTSDGGPGQGAGGTGGAGGGAGGSSGGAGGGSGGASGGSGGGSNGGAPPPGPGSEDTANGTEPTRPPLDPAGCADIPRDDTLEGHGFISYRYRCVPVEEYMVDGPSLGFTDVYSIGDVRPGMNVGPCSTSFLLSDGIDYFLVQSAHCVFATEGDTFCSSTYKAVGDEVAIEGYDEPGTVAWVSGLHMQEHGARDAMCSSWDVAFIRLPPSLHDRIHPAIRHVGGPVGLADIFDIDYRDDMVGYGNSDDRGFVVEMVSGQDHGSTDYWPAVNVFTGYFVGSVLNEGLCPLSCSDNTVHGYRTYIRYSHPKITGDSGSGDLTAAGEAFGVTSVINLATALTGSVPLYDTLQLIEADTGKVYRLVTWDEWSPDTLETEQLP